MARRRRLAHLHTLSEALGGSHVRYVKDTDHDKTRLEAQCKRCGGHLGHIFLGHKSENQNERHCVNSRSIRWIAGGSSKTSSGGHTHTTKNIVDNTMGNGGDEIVKLHELNGLSIGEQSKMVPEELKAELDDVKFAPDDPRNKPLSVLPT